jgi:CxxC-x17-CxxC domain-containing protein
MTEENEEAPQADSEQVADANDAEAAAMNSSDDTGANNDDRDMHKAVCSECKKDCEVPFEPTEGKPVYCKDCYMAKKPKRNFGGGGNRGNFGGGNRGNFNRGPREMHDATCSECKKDCQVPFKPSGDKPVLCGDCYKKSKGF